MTTTDPLDEALQDAGFEMVRYADDFIVLCQSSQGAELARQISEQVLAELKISLNTEKTRLTDFSRGFVFLGTGFIDQLTMPLTEHTETSWLNAVDSEQNDEHLQRDEADDIATGQELNQAESDDWNLALSPAQLQLQSYISEQPDIQLIDPPTLSVSQVARLRSLYIQRQGSVLHLIKGQFEVRHKGQLVQKYLAVPST